MDANDLIDRPLRSDAGDQSEARAGLDAALLLGVAWTSAAKLGTQIVTWVSTVLVARMLVPEDYGVFGMALIVIGFANLLADFGIGSAVVRFRALTSGQLRGLQTLSVLMGAASAVACVAVSGPVAVFFDTVALRAVMPVLALSFVVTGLRVVPEGLLRRDLQFRTLALVDAVGALGAAVTTLMLAWMGAGYWALVGGELAASVIRAGPLIWLRGVGVGRVRWVDVREPFNWSGHLLASRLAWYTYSNADFAVAGRLLGESALGFYQFAWSLATLPVTKVTDLQARVVPGVLSAVQDQVSELRRYVLRITEIMAMVLLPAAVGMAFVAEDFVLAVLGSKWAGMVTPLVALSLAAPIRALAGVGPQVLATIGETRRIMWYSLFQMAVLPPAFVAAASWGVGGIAVVWLIIYPLTVVPLYVLLFSRLRMRTGEYVRALWPSVSSSLVMLAVLTPLSVTTLEAAPSWTRLAALSSVGATVYIGAVWFLHRHRLSGMRGLLGVQAAVTVAQQGRGIADGHGADGPDTRPGV